MLRLSPPLTLAFDVFLILSYQNSLALAGAYGMTVPELNIILPFIICLPFILQLSYGSSSPILSDRNRFPNFFRLGGPDQKLNPAKIAVMREFNWKKVATINQALEFFSVVRFSFILVINIKMQ